MPALDLSTILSQAAKATADINAGATALQSTYQSQAKTSNDTVDVLSIIGQNDQIIALSKAQNQQATNAAITRAANELGTNYRDQGQRISDLTATIHEEYAAKDAALKEIEKKDSVGLTDDPISYIFNQLTINDDISRHNAANARLTAAEEQLNRLNALTQTTATTQRLIDDSVNAATIKATTDSLAAATQIKKNEAFIQGQTYNAEAIKAVLGASKDQLQVAFSVYGAQKQQEQIGIALAHLDLDRQRFDWQKQEKDDLKKGDSYTLEKINMGGRMMMGAGWQDIPTESAKAKEAIGLLKSGSPVGKFYQEAYMTAERSLTVDPSGNTRQLATSPAHAIDVLNTFPIKLTPAQEPVKAVLEQAKNMVAQAIQTGTLDGKNKALVESTLNSTVGQIIKDQARQIKPGDSENVFNIGSIGTLISSSPTIKALPVIQKVVAPALASGADLTDPNKIFSLVATALKDKTISYQEALDISTIYHVGVGTNLEARQFSSLGIVPSYSYNTKIQTNPAANFGDTEVIDLTKPDVVGRALNKWLSAASNPFAQNTWR